MAIKLIIGGEPHSGKSTFMSMLSDRLKARGIGVELLDLDLASPTICYLYSGDERTRCKKIWDSALSAEARKQFEDAQGQVVLADSVGKITDVTRTITHPADASIIVSVNHGNIQKWQKFYSDMGKPVVSVVESGRNCASVYDAYSKRGKICDISREKYVRGEMGFDPVVEQLTNEIVEMFRLTPPAANRGMYMSNPRKKVSKREMRNVLKQIENKRRASRRSGSQRIYAVYDTAKFPQLKAEVSPEQWKRMVRGMDMVGDVKVRGGGKYRVRHQILRINPRKSSGLAKKIDPLVVRYVTQWRTGDYDGANRTRKLIEEIAGKDAMPFAPMSREIECPHLFAKTISCSSQVLEKQGKTKVKPWAVCRAALRKSPCGKRNPLNKAEQKQMRLMAKGFRQASTGIFHGFTPEQEKQERAKWKIAAQTTDFIRQKYAE